MRSAIAVTLTIACITLFFLCPACVLATADPPAILPGMTCHGLSSFSGGSLEKLDIDIIGVVDGANIESRYILARVDSPSVRRGGIIAGMSGSPVYFGDQLIGAIALAYPFSKEPVCGITPIQAMRRLFDLSLGAGRSNGYRPRRDLFQQPASHHISGLMPIGLSMQMEGFAAGNVSGVFSGDTLIPALSTVQRDNSPADTANRTARPIRPGTPIGVNLVSGDVAMTAFGTVTDVNDNTVLAFGHAMFGLGRCRLPLHQSDVVSFIPSMHVSFKIANSGPAVGALTFDSNAGVMGELGAIAPVIPVDITIEGFSTRPQAYRIQVADHESLTTNLIAQSALGLIRNVGGFPGDLSMETRLHLELDNGLEMDRIYYFGTGENLPDMVFAGLQIIESIHQNPLEPVHFRRIGVHYKMAQKTRIATLDAVSVFRRQYKPGEIIHSRLRFHGDRIESFDHSVQIRIPQNLPPGRYMLKVLDAVSHAREVAQSSLPSHHYQSLNDWFDTLNNTLAGNQVMVALTTGSHDVQIGGTVLPAAPPVLRSVLNLPGVDNRSFSSSRILASEVIAFEVEVFGTQQIPVFINVKPEDR